MQNRSSFLLLFFLFLFIHNVFVFARRTSNARWLLYILICKLVLSSLPLIVGLNLFICLWNESLTLIIFFKSIDKLIGAHLVKLFFCQCFNQSLCDGVFGFLISVEQNFTLTLHLVESANYLICRHGHHVILIGLDIVILHLFFLLSSILQILDLLHLLCLGQFRRVTSMLISQSQEWSLVLISLDAFEVLILALLVDLVTIGLVMLHQLLVKACLSFLLPIEYLHDLFLVHVDIREV